MSVDMDAIYNYRPQPGTIPHRVIEHLRSLPPGTWLSVAQINEAIGQPCDTRLASAMSRAKFAGLVVQRRAKGRQYHEFSIGDGRPMAQPGADEDEGDAVDLRAQRIKPVVPTAEALRSANPWAAASIADDSPGGKAHLQAHGISITVTEQSVDIGTVVGACSLTRRQADFLLVALTTLSQVVEASR